MSAREKQASNPAAHARGDEDGSFSSLTRTLEDLESRLNRLSGSGAAPMGRNAASAQSPIEADEDLAEEEAQAPRSTTARLRAVIEQRVAQRMGLESASSRLALEAADGSGRAGDEHLRRRRAASALDRRFGTIAGEVETLQMQGATLQLVTSVADELQALKAEINDRIVARNETGFGAIQESFQDLRSALEARADDETLGLQVAAILEKLSQMEASGADKMSMEAMRSELDEVAQLVAAVSREDTVAAVTRRWDAFEERLSHHVELDQSARRDLQQELERLRETVRSLATEEQVRAVESRWEDFEQRYFETAATQRKQAEAQFGDILKREMNQLRSRLDSMETTLASSDLEANVSRVSARLGELEEALVNLPELLGVDRLERQLSELAESVALLAEEQQTPDLEHFMVLEERLDEIAQAIVATAVREETPFDMAPVERIEARVADLAARVERLAAAGDSQALSQRVAELSERIEALAAQPGAVVLEERFEAFSSRVEEALSGLQGAQPEIAAFEARLAALAARLEEAARTRLDDDVMRSLETQIARLAEQLSQGPAARSEDDSETRERLTAIERKLDEGRADVMAAARSAADEAVRLMRESASRDGDHVRDLSEDLRSLEALCRETDDRSIQVFEAVHSTLLKIVERLSVIEGEVRATGSSRPAAPAEPAARESQRKRAPAVETVLPVAFAAQGVDPVEPSVSASAVPAEQVGLRAAIARHLGGRPEPETSRSASQALADAVASRPGTHGAVETLERPERPLIEDAPSLDASDSIVAREVNRPLEPGSGAPDIASLLERVRQQQRSMAGETGEPGARADLIAAARKAALAAAAEADHLRADPADGGSENGEPVKGGRHRKPILMAVGAVLLALMAIPLGRSYLESDLPQIAATPAPVESATGSVQEPGPVTPPVVETATQAAQPVPQTPPQAAAIQPIPVEPAVPQAATADPIVAIVPPQADAQSSSMVQTAASEQPALIAGPQPGPSAPSRSAADLVPAPSDGSALAQALSALPASAQADLPAAPSGVGNTALVAAADGGDPKAIFEVGLRIMEGRSGPADPAAALPWFTHAASLGYAPAQYSLGTMFEKGTGLERNTVAARDWYLLAAGQGNVRAMHNLAVLYATGIDGRSEPATAAKWFVDAAEHGMRDSQYNLGILHARGAGVEQDLAQSYKWFSIVAASGDQDALDKRNEVAKALSAEDVARIDGEVAGWTPREREESANSVDIPAEWREAPEQTASVDMRRAVRNVQAILIKLGFDPGSPDGVVGERTAEAVRAFQQANGLTATGEIDETLIRELLKQNG